LLSLHNPWVSQDQQHKAERRTKRKASKNQQQVQPNTLYFSGWVLVVTTLPPQHWSDEQILGLYQAHWHIELLFKRIKQLLQRQSLRCKTAATAKSTITLLLLGWALLEEESAAVRLAIRDAMQATVQTHQGTLAFRGRFFLKQASKEGKKGEEKATRPHFLLR
jgi:transposase